ncbi:MAG: hypothetical protein Q8876_01075 [Bacillota bacterium]|nr:hypothetical protein [Bacillota bacterium]
MGKEIVPVTLPTPPLSAADKLFKRQDDLEDVIADLIIKQFGGSVNEHG